MESEHLEFSCLWWHSTLKSQMAKTSFTDFFHCLFLMYKPRKKKEKKWTHSIVAAGFYFYAKEKTSGALVVERLPERKYK